MYQRIVVPLDGSRLAEEALPTAERMASLLTVPILLLRVVDLTQLPWYGQFGMSMEYVASEQALLGDTDAATSYIQTVAERITASGIPVVAEVRRGLTTRVLIEATRPGDLIVMASHGRSGMTRFFLGSVAEEILRHALVPVLLIKAGEAIAAEVEAGPPAVEASPLLVAAG